MIVIVAVLAGLIAFEYAYSWLFLRGPRRVHIGTYGSKSNLRTSIVFPGFSNPPREFGQGMKRILDQYGPMLVVHHTPKFYFDEVYDALMTALEELNGPREILVYGHSMGGQLGSLFRERYEQEGSSYGTIRELFLDCTPSTARSVIAPNWLKPVIRLAFAVYRGGPLMSLLIAIGHHFTKLPPLSTIVDPQFYRRYTRRLRWHNSRSWVAQLKHVLSHRLPATPFRTLAQVYYIGAADPSRDAVVRQTVAIPDWRRVYPSLKVILHAGVGHAWPLEQPETYDEIVHTHVRTARA